jgi:hypothetical protein
MQYGEGLECRRPDRGRVDQPVAEMEVKPSLSCFYSHLGRFPEYGWLSVGPRKDTAMRATAGALDAGVSGARRGSRARDSSPTHCLSCS